MSGCSNIFCIFFVFAPLPKEETFPSPSRGSRSFSCGMLGVQGGYFVPKVTNSLLTPEEGRQ